VPACPECGAPLASRGLIESARDGAPATRALWECTAQARHRYAAWADQPGELAVWSGGWWPLAGRRADLEADRPPHWS